MKLILSCDGTEIDSTEVLEYFASEVFLLLQPGEIWTDPSQITPVLPEVDKVIPAPLSTAPSTPLPSEPPPAPVQHTTPLTPTHPLNLGIRPETPPPDDDRYSTGDETPKTSRGRQ